MNRKSKYRYYELFCFNIIFTRFSTGGYKVGALHVERILMEHPDIKEVAVCGVDDITWGQKVGAVISLEDSSSTLSLEELRKWAKEKLPKYAIPSLLHVMDTLPRSVGGTVNKKELVDVAFPISTIH